MGGGGGGGAEEEGRGAVGDPMQTVDGTPSHALPGE